MSRRKVVFTVALVALAAAACSDGSGPDAVFAPSEPLSSHTAQCSLLPPASLARQFLTTGNASLPARNGISSRLDQIHSLNCLGEDAERLSWEVLAIVEGALEAGLARDPAAGASLVNGVLDCCISLGSGVVDARALSPRGSFGVRGALPPTSSPPISNSDPVLSRGAVSVLFVAEDGSSETRSAVVGVRPGSDWSEVVKGAGIPGTFIDDVTLVHGIPVGAAPHLVYSLNEAPKQGFQPGNRVDVFFCFTDQKPDPGEADGLTPRLRRNGVLIQGAGNAEEFCQQWVWSNPDLMATGPASRLGRFLGWAGGLLSPVILYARQTLRTTPVLSGSASNFSEFGAVNALAGGGLQFLTVPPGVVVGLDTPVSVTVRAVSGGGSAIQGVEVVLTKWTNQGVPGQIEGTFTDCSGATRATAVACTDQENGVAAFEFTMGQAGGYTICATATQEGFEFGDVCTRRFNVRR